MTRRMLFAAAVLTLPLLAVSPAVAGPPAPAAATVVPAEDPAAAAAVRAITDPAVDASAQVRVVPDGLGYRAAAGPGYAVNPHGDCSSVLRLPAEFTAPCRAHDLGYDLLRHADAVGRPLGPWARQRIDGAFADRLHAACGARTAGRRRACRQVAVVSVAAVRLNTWRQHDGPPTAETATALTASWFTAGGRL